MALLQIAITGRASGCGKTTFGALLVAECARRGLTCERVDDYDVLEEMWRSGDPRFTSHGDGPGFDCSESALLDALRTATARVSASDADVVGLEFVRGAAGLDQTVERLLDTQPVIVYVEADLESCWERCRRRVSEGGQPTASRTHFEAVYGQPTLERLRALLSRARPGPELRVITNSGTLEQFHELARTTIDAILRDLAPMR